MGFSLLMLMGWIAVIIGGIILIQRGKDSRNNMLVTAGSLLIAIVTVYGFYSLILG